MGIFRKLADVFNKKQEPTPDLRTHSQPGGYGLSVPDPRKSGTGDVEASRLTGSSSVKFASGADWHLARPEMPPVSDTRGKPQGVTGAPLTSKDMKYGEHVAPARSNDGWASDRAHAPSKVKR